MNELVQQLWFNAPRQLEIRSHAIATPGVGEVLVEVVCSAISAGTEMLVYRGQIPTEIALDATIDSLQHQQYPLQYGYACVGKVAQVGQGVEKNWLGKQVFAFQPHASRFVARVENIIPVPDDVTAEDAVFLANMETAVNLVQDGKPVLGERVVVLGQGIVGLLLASLLAQFPLTEVIAADNWPLRRAHAVELGLHVFNPAVEDEKKFQQRRMEAVQGADLIYELTGVPDALNFAIDLSGYHSRIVIGSWYGTKSAPVYLGGAAHRNRLQITTSQVSSIAPALSARWDKSRRFEATWNMIRRVKPSRFISHREPLSQAPQLYKQLDEQPEASIQALFIY